MAFDKNSSIGVLVASLVGGGTGVAAWVDLNVGVAENTQAIVAQKDESKIHRDYLKEELLEIKQLIKDLDRKD